MGFAAVRRSETYNFMTINFNIPIIKFTSKSIRMASATHANCVFPLSNCNSHCDCLTDNFKQADLELSTLNRDITF